MVTVVIPTLNAERVIGRLCETLSAQTVPCEIVVVDSSSSDRTVSIAEEHGAQVISIKKQDFSHGTTRNLGAAAGHGDILVFLTQDALPCNALLIENLTAPLMKGSCAASYGRQVPHAHAIPPEKIARLYNYPPSPSIKDKTGIPLLGIKTFFFSNVCSAIRKDIFDEMEGFPHHVIMDEDLFFAARLILAGHKIAYAAEAQVFHSHNYRLARQFRRYFDTGVFFSGNTWLLSHVRLGGEGGSFVRRQLSSLLETKSYRWVPYALGEIVAKYLGYTLGFHHRIVPKTLKKYLSLQQAYWEQSHETPAGSGPGGSP